MACKITFISFTLLLLLELTLSAPTSSDQQVEVIKDKEELAPAEKEDLRAAASNWGGHYGGGWGGWGGHWGGGYYPHYGSYWSWPSYGYGYWPYGHYGHHGYWW